VSLDNHKPGCPCPRCQGKARTAEREAAEREQAQTRSDAAWFTVMAAGGPDAVIALARQHGDMGRAIRLLEAGGFPVADITDRWRAEVPQVRQFSSNANLFADDPEHSPEAMEALRTGGAAAWNAAVERLREKRAYARAKANAAARAATVTPDGYVGLGLLSPAVAQVLAAEGAREPGALWTGRDGQPVMENARDGAPHVAQRSVVFPDHGGAA